MEFADRIQVMPHLLMRSLQNCSGLQSLLDCALARGLELTGTTLGNLQLMNWHDHNLIIAAQRGFDDKFLDFFRCVSPKSGSACARAVRQRCAIVIEDVFADHEFAPYRMIALEAGFRAVQSTPLISSSGAFVGVLSTHFSNSHKPTELDKQAMAAVAGVTANAIIRQRAIGTTANVSANDCEEGLEKAFQQIIQAREAVERSYELLRQIGRKHCY
jgi:GAF domain-containing protein